MALVGLGHLGDLHGFAALTRAPSSTVPAPLRNVHKFDVVLRIPLVLGLAHLLGVVRLRLMGNSGCGFSAAPVGPCQAGPRQALVTATAVTAIIGVASPALAGGLPAPGSFREVPKYWHDAADWLNWTTSAATAYLAAAGSPVHRLPLGQHGRGSLTQPLLDRSWAVRNSIPLTPPSTIRLLDAVESALADGRGVDGPRRPARAVRACATCWCAPIFDYGKADAVRPLVVRQALARSPGFTLAARFGPKVGGEPARRCHR